MEQQAKLHKAPAFLEFELDMEKKLAQWKQLWAELLKHRVNKLP